MHGNDNATVHPASEYDQNIRKNIPHYDDIHAASINIVRSSGIDPALWVDIGCGTGTLVEKAYAIFPSTAFVLADPSAAMLNVAAERLEGKDHITILQPVEAKDVSIELSADVVTAIQSLHYQAAESRSASVQNCYRLLRTGGIFVTFENIKPFTEKGIEIGKDNWRRFQERVGKSSEETRKHIERFGVEYFPITVEEHLQLLRDRQFRTVELLWYSYMQAGFFCIK